nr:MAG: capsid protein [Wufeng shrew dicistrovirus 2]
MTPMILNKLDGFTSFRATAVVRVQINSQPFQQGRLILAAIPMPSLIGPRDEYLTMHPSLLQSINHVQVDISKQTEISLRIPFISPFNSYDLISGQYPWARVVCMVYSKLVDKQTLGVPIQVWLHFEDVVLGTATSGVYKQPDGVAVQQSGKMPGAKAPKQSQGKPSMMPSEAQIAPTRQVEQSGHLVGLAHSITDGAATLYDSIGSAIPFLKPITDIFSSLASPTKTIASHLFGWLGFSKPQVGFSGITVVNRPCEGFGSANGVDHSHVLGLDRLNAVDVYPGLGGTSFDEQDLHYLARIPQFVGQFLYTSNADEMKYENVLWSTYVMPSYFLPGSLQMSGGESDCDASKINTLQPTILNYISSFFAYWTGSLVYTFRFVKTDYHSGRVEVSFHPFTNDVKSERMAYAYRAVIDLRETTEVSLVVPFVSPQPWKRVTYKDPLYKGDGDKWGDYGPSSIGRLQVRPVTPLILSNTVVSEEVHCVVEVRAGDDYRLQAPVRTGYLSFSPAHNTEQKDSEEPNCPDDGWPHPGCNGEPKAVQQSGPIALPGTAETRTSAIEGYQPPSITTSTLDTHRVDTQQLCAGEQFANFRSLTRKFAFVEKENQFPTYRSNMSRYAIRYLAPPQMRKTLAINTKSLPVAAALFEFNIGHSPLSQISGLYAFYRGSIRFKIFAPTVKKLISARCVDLEDIQVETKALNGKRVILPYNASTAYELPDIKGFAEFQLPFYAPVIISVPADYLRRSEFDQSACGIDFSFFSTSADEKTDVHLAVGAGDDMTFHGFIGIPPTISAAYFRIPVRRIDCGGSPQNVDPFYQVRYGGANGNADPCYDITPEYAPDWTIQPFVSLKIRDLKFNITNIQGNKTNKLPLM